MQIINKIHIKSLIKLLGLLIIISLSANACKKDEDNGEEEHEEELITTLLLILTDPSNNETTFSFRDVDGDGGNAPVIDDIQLTANTTYTASIEVLNEAESPAEDITEEIKAEDEDHLFLFNPSGSLNLSVNITDQDSNSDPVGLMSRIETGAASSGTLQIILKHQPDKNNPASTGETDIDVTFEVEIQ